MDGLLNPRLIGVAGPVEGGFFALGDSEITIGRDPSNHLPINDPSLSKRHCSIRKLTPEQFEIRDLGSRHGTAVNGLPVTFRVLGDRDEIRLGGSRFLFLLWGSDEPSSSVPIQLDQAALDAGTIQRLPDGNRLMWEPLLYEAAAHSRVSSRLAVLFKIARGAQVARGSEDIARHALEGIFEIVPAGQGSVLLFEGAGEDPVFAFSQDRDGAPRAEARVFGAIVAQTRREGIAALASVPLPGGLSRRVLAAPIPAGDKTLGVIYLEAADPAVAFDDQHLQLAAAAGGILGLPFENARRLEWLQAENRRLQEAFDLEHDMVGGGARMREVFQLVSKVAPTSSTVLIRGESGTGKELVARAIHRNSPRSGQPFVAINCAALTETLLESELFGHEKGAFTGAIAQKQGKLEIADRGTLFLDEVGELPMPFQTKLLRVLQEREFERVGGSHSIRVDVRLIAATNRDLEDAMAANVFRADLYYRLNVVSLSMPPLRDRREDIPVLASHFAAKHSKRAKRRVAGLSREALSCLKRYDWPGNVRELENAMERAVVLGSTDLIMPDDLPEAILESAPAALRPGGGYHQAVQEEKKRAILDALAQSAGNYTEAAKLLSIHPNYLHRLIRNLDLKDKVAQTLSLPQRDSSRR